MILSPKYDKYLIHALLVGGGFLAGFFVHNYNFEKAQADLINNIQSVRDNNQSFKFINPLLFYKLPSSAILPAYQPLVSNLQKIVSNQKSAHKISSASVYYRDLDGDHWVGINETQKYAPASLLKVVIMSAYLKQGESKPNLFSERITYTKEIENRVGSLPYLQKNNLELNHSYSVEDLINRMIVESDNSAAYTLLSKVDPVTLHELYIDLDLSDPAQDNSTYTISAQEYSRFFRILYNATYLDEKTSEKALSILSGTNYNDGLIAGLPSNLIVSHKYGESVLADPATKAVTTIELHDCGIVYVPNKPYFLCVMTQGDDLDNLKASIKEISAAVYSSVISRKD